MRSYKILRINNNNILYSRNDGSVMVELSAADHVLNQIIPAELCVNEDIFKAECERLLDKLEEDMKETQANQIVDNDNHPLAKLVGEQINS